MNKKILKLFVFGLTCAAVVQLPLTAAQSAPKLDAPAYQDTWHAADMADRFSLGLNQGFPQKFTGNSTLNQGGCGANNG